MYISDEKIFFNGIELDLEYNIALYIYIPSYRAYGVFIDKGITMDTTFFLPCLVNVNVESEIIEISDIYDKNAKNYNLGFGNINKNVVSCSSIQKLEDFCDFLLNKINIPKRNKNKINGNIIFI